MDFNYSYYQVHVGSLLKNWNACTEESKSDHLASSESSLIALYVHIKNTTIEW